MEKNQHKVPVEKNHGYFGKAVILSRDDICIHIHNTQAVKKNTEHQYIIDALA